MVHPRLWSSFAKSAPGSSFFAGFAVVLCFAAALAAGVWYVGELLVASTDATVTVDRPGFGEEERDAGDLLREEAQSYAGWAFFVPFVVWFSLDGLVHLVARSVHGEGGFAETLAVVGWAFVPESLRLGAGLVAVRSAASRIDPDAPIESFSETFVAALTSFDAPLLAVGVVVLLCQRAILTAGLEETHDLPTLTAALAVGAPAPALGAAHAPRVRDQNPSTSAETPMKITIPKTSTTFVTIGMVMSSGSIPSL
ncbi:YIP1 family protein [Natronorarus salvus]|uniref:YIP1 family protein n=1 Tax=Natronorarus salvus TaxID=3117733 RepID=UPI002F2670AC